MQQGIELIPSERAVLSQVRDIFLEGSIRTYRLNVLTARWPVTHFDAYRAGFAGLVRRGWLEPSPDERFFSITNAGLRAML